MLSIDRTGCLYPVLLHTATLVVKLIAADVSGA